MCRLYEVGCVLFRTRRIFPRINGPITFCSTSLTCSSIRPHAHTNFSYFLSGTQPVPGVRMWSVARSKRAGKNKEGERRERVPLLAPTPYPTLLLFYFAHISPSPRSEHLEQGLWDKEKVTSALSFLQK